jgi:hypothetical protein
MYSAIDVIVGGGIMVGFALVFSYLTYRDLFSFMVFLTFFSAWVVWAGLLPLWVCILSILGLIFIILIQNKREGGI